MRGDGRRGREGEGRGVVTSRKDAVVEGQWRERKRGAERQREVVRGQSEREGERKERQTG